MHTTIIGLPTHWRHGRRFEGRAIRDLPTWFIAWALGRDFPERDIAALRAEMGFRVMIGDQREGH